MPVIETIQSRAGLGGAPAPAVRVDNSIGEGISQLGGALQRAASVEQELQLREMRMEAENANFQAVQQFERFNTALTPALDEVAQGVDASGTGLTSGFIKQFDEKANEFLQGVPVGMRGKFEELTATARGEWVARAAKEENTKRQAWFRDGISQQQQRLEIDVYNDPQSYDRARQQGLDTINSSGLPAAEKSDLAKQWENTLAVRIAQRGIEDDPNAVLNGIGIARVQTDDQTRSNYLDVAKSFVGANEQTDAKALAAFIKRSAGVDIDPRQTAWCAAYVNAVLGSAGIQGTGSLAARSFLDFGTPTETPKVGDIVVLSRGGPETGHVGFFAGYDGQGNVRILGGNQSNSVSVQSYAKERILGFRQPPSVKGSPEDFAGIPGGAPGYGMVVGKEDPRFASLTLDQRLKILGAAQQQIASRQTQAQAVQKAAQDNAVDDLTLGITMGTVTGEEEILANPYIDNGQKSTLIEKYRTAQRENAGVSELIGQITGGGQVSINSFDADQRKVADKAYDRIIGAVAPEVKQSVTNSFVQSTGYIPEREKASLRNAYSSSNPLEVANALAKADAYDRMAHGQFSSAEGFSDLQKGLDLYRAYTRDMGYSPQEAAVRISQSRNPETKRARDAILASPETKKTIQAVSSKDVAAIFDAGFWSRAPGVGMTIPNERIQLGVNQTSESVIVGEYRSILEESLVDTNGDMDLAKSIANERFQRVYGPSSMTFTGSNVVLKNPPEKTYPPGPDGTHAYVREQAIEALKAEGVTTEEVALMPYSQTDEDVQAGRPAQYQLFYRDGNAEWQLFQLPFYAEPQVARQRADQEIMNEIQTRRDLFSDRQTEAETTVTGPRRSVQNPNPQPLISVTRDREAVSRQFGVDPNAMGGRTTVDGIREQMRGLSDYFFSGSAPRRTRGQ